MAIRQRRLADALDELLSDLDAAVAALEGPRGLQGHIERIGHIAGHHRRADQ